MYRVALFLFALLLTLPAHAQYADGDRLEKLEKKMTTIERAIYRDNAPVDTSSTDSMPPEESASTGVRITQLEEKINGLQGKIEELEHQITQLQNATPAPAPVAEQPRNIIPDWNAPSPTEDASNAALANPVEEAYERAFAALREKRYGEAIIGFKDFVATYPGHVLGSNAYYWMGESYYAQKEYEPAAVNFLQGYQEFPKGGKAPDSLLKLAMAMGNLKKTTEACASLKKLSAEFPDASAALRQRAEQEKGSLKCN